MDLLLGFSVWISSGVPLLQVLPDRGLVPGLLATWMSDCPLTLSEVRAVSKQLKDLEEWLLAREEQSSSSQPKGSRTGGIASRGKAVFQATPPAFQFPGISQLSWGWKLVKEAGPDFKETFPDLCVRGLEEGPGSIPTWLEDQADFICSDPREAIQRLHVAYSSGFFARIALDTFTEHTWAVKLSEPAEHFVVLRAVGLGGHLRFASKEDFERLRDRTGAVGLVAQGFASETEVSVFCIGARVTLPALIARC